MLKLNSPIIVTGSAGFIGAAVTDKLLNICEEVIGIDNLNNYYDKNLKLARLKQTNLLKKKNFFFYENSIEDFETMNKIFSKHKPKIVVNLAAQAGVRYSLKDPFSYVKSNLLGFTTVLECCRNFHVSNLIYASSSSVYGANKLMPFNENHTVNHPVSFYAATKISNELMAHSYSYLYGIPSTGLRFFTVYGPWGRPDMAPMIFAKSILQGKPIDVFNYGNMMRDFTYIDDIVDGIIKCCNKPATAYDNFSQLKPVPSISFSPHRIFNIGNGKPIKLLDFIEILEDCLGKKAIKNFVPINKADIQETYSDTRLLNKWVGFKANIDIKEGVQKFADWYMKYQF